VAVAGRLDGFQRRHRWAGFPLAVVYKYVDDFGAYLAALLTYYGFVSLFPLLLLMSQTLLPVNDRAAPGALPSRARNGYGKPRHGRSCPPSVFNRCQRTVSAVGRLSTRREAAN
jgi:hypothetical protein